MSSEQTDLLMKTTFPPTLKFFPVLLILTAAQSVVSQDPGELLEFFLETGSLEFAEQIREDYPDSPHASFLSAWEYIGANNEIARDLSEDMIEEFPDFAPAYLAFGTVLSQGFKQHRESIVEFDRCLDLEEDFVLAYQNRGIAKLGLNDFKAASEDFEKLMKLQRGYAQGYLLRGVAGLGLGDEESMKADFEIGLQLDYRALAMIPGDLADEAMDKAIEAAPDNAIYFFARGYARFLDGNYRTAGADFSKCVELVPGSSDFYKYSGACKMYMSDFQSAQRDMNLALSVNPDDPEIYYFLGILANDFQDQAAKAAEYLNHAIELDENNPDYYYQRSRASYKMLDYLEARNDINTALRLDHRKGDFYAHRGNIKMKLGNPNQDFCPDYTKALEWGTSYNLKRIMKKNCR